MILAITACKSALHVFAERGVQQAGGELYGKVKGFQAGSFWELVKEGGKLMLILTLEKLTKSVAPNRRAPDCMAMPRDQDTMIADGTPPYEPDATATGPAPAMAPAPLCAGRPSPAASAPSAGL
ncbi:predicted protein [Haematococcus lacustris]|uniref:Uncharacterized protein n=1 Tax=Haematococcus lacustris TaxID=44745 RepID=A0A699Z452_HAELA|nr:predicted protein [Haematococcus lacustris]